MASPPVRVLDRTARSRTLRCALLLALDAVAALSALQVASWLRFDGSAPPRYAEVIAIAAPVVLVTRLLCNVVADLYRWSFRLAGMADALRVIAAGLAGTVVLAGLARLTSPAIPRGVVALEFFFATAAFAAVRFLPRTGARWLRFLTRRRAGAQRAIIVGVGDSGELLARDLQRSEDGAYDLVGFVGDDATMVGCRIDGAPVLGVLEDLPEVVRRHRVATVLLADPHQPAARTREILRFCSSCRTRFKIMPASPARLGERVSAAMLGDVSPDDLLPRDAVAFDERLIAERVRGRRVLVTGAGGSIGAELSAQLARHGVGKLVMLDMNENELYLHGRALAEQYPRVDVRLEVADVREPGPLLRIGERHAPQDVFHAAAHKHVPLMEDAPAEAVKNNVFGTLHVARMADACGAERLVLISTDKAVKPTSVMGATKRVAELVVRHVGRASATRMGVVRFGNVLGSAGSVVPLFKHQIGRGGPVTVTHPLCTRYFMTIPEAVGLVLLAGFGDYGELCVLDMGEPIRIADLARNMITLAGFVPDEDVRIVYTGLRPGEKLQEQVLTEEEERVLRSRSRIRVTRSPPPPADLDECLEALRRFAADDDRDRLLGMLHALVPTYANGNGATAGGPTEGPAPTPAPISHAVPPPCAPEGAAAAI